MKMEFEVEIKEEFNKLMKAGKVSVFKLMDEVDGYIDETQTLTMVERRMDAIVKQVRTEKKFYFNQFKEVWPFVLSERKLKEALEEKDDYIILE
jgi:hypothetical protein